jgi:hypothetical protein
MYVVRPHLQWHPLFCHLLLCSRARAAPVTFAPPTEQDDHAAVALTDEKLQRRGDGERRTGKEKDAEKDGSIILSISLPPSRSTCWLQEKRIDQASLRTAELFSEMLRSPNDAVVDAQRHRKCCMLIASTMRHVWGVHDAYRETDIRDGALDDLAVSYASAINFMETIETTPSLTGGEEVAEEVAAATAVARFVFGHCGMLESPFPLLSRLAAAEFCNTVANDSAAEKDSAPLEKVMSKAGERLRDRYSGQGRRSSLGEGGQGGCGVVGTGAHYAGGLQAASRCVPSTALRSYIHRRNR